MKKWIEYEKENGTVVSNATSSHGSKRKLDKQEHQEFIQNTKENPTNCLTKLSLELHPPVCDKIVDKELAQDGYKWHRA